MVTRCSTEERIWWVIWKRTANGIQIFARKIIRPTGMLTKADIDTQGLVIDKLCNGSHKNIVRVFGHGYLPNSPHYFFDMELCDMSLEDYVFGHITDTENKLKVDGPGLVWAVMTDVVSGLEFIHSHHEIHRDLK